MTDYKKMREMVVQAGMDNKISKLFVEKFKIEEKTYVCDESRKEWAMSKGFFPGRIELYGLNDNNYRNYVSDFSDFMMHPYNNHFKIWISDKLSLKYTISGVRGGIRLIKQCLIITSILKITEIIPI